MKKKLDNFKPSPYFSWAVHIDGLRERHEQSVEREGVFDQAVAAIKEAKARGFRVTTNTTFFNTDTPQTVRDVLDYLNDELQVDGMMISPGVRVREGARPGALPRRRRRRASCSARRSPTASAKKWRLNHTPLFLDFLEGKVDFAVHAVGDPELLHLRLAAALLPDGRRLRGDVQGAARDDRLGPVRARQGRPAARTAWRTAATSRPRCCDRWARSASRCVQSSRARAVSQLVRAARATRRLGAVSASTTSSAASAASCERLRCGPRLRSGGSRLFRGSPDVGDRPRRSRSPRRRASWPHGAI